MTVEPVEMKADQQKTEALEAAKATPNPHRFKLQNREAQLAYLQQKPEKVHPHQTRLTKARKQPDPEGKEG